MDRLSDLPFDQVGIENRQPTAELVAHLSAQGHQRIMLIAGDTRVATLRERLEAFDDAVTQAGLPAKGQVKIAAAQADVVDAQIEEAFDRPDRPTAAIACSTVLAAAALRIIQRRRLRMPEDIAFATFDGFAYADLFEPRLTTVRHPAFEVGVTAADLLAQRIEDKTAAHSLVRIAPTIEYRDSTGSAAVS
jgi:LacI family transcriptional regulator